MKSREESKGHKLRTESQRKPTVDWKETRVSRQKCAGVAVAAGTNVTLSGLGVGAELPVVKEDGTLIVE